jgi:hypothetical protein
MDLSFPISFKNFSLRSPVDLLLTAFFLANLSF